MLSNTASGFDFGRLCACGSPWHPRCNAMPLTPLEGGKLLPYRDEMRRALAALLEVTEAQVNIKATTTEQLGFIGRGEGIAAQAVALIE